ncbi:myristoylated alanine-rich C-kinase substrate-like [Grus americana]|uniref:myristoylated alanine-rich C-kinase substrate-like n=1 Tax=Grus americana TaxID=9117 RepID=UPI0024085DF5|nr:myristoylated alanine-rich C-kinase substrate-like [Grus americana]
MMSSRITIPHLLYLGGPHGGAGRRPGTGGSSRHGQGPAWPQPPQPQQPPEENPLETEAAGHQEAAADLRAEEAKPRSPVSDEEDEEEEEDEERESTLTAAPASSRAGVSGHRPPPAREPTRRPGKPEPPAPGHLLPGLRINCCTHLPAPTRH